MNFDKHSELEGTHAFLSPSNYSWVNYTEEKLIQRYLNQKAIERGTRLHAFAKEAIELNQPMPRTKTTLCMYVNDALGFKMTPEQPLFYSFNCYGTADAIDYKKNILRIHDLKTGENEASMKQLYIYAALFCLNYQEKVRLLRKKGRSDNDIAHELDVKVNELHFEPERMADIILRIYQNNEVREEHPDPLDIRELMNIIVSHDKVLNQLKAEE